MYPVSTVQKPPEMISPGLPAGLCALAWNARGTQLAFGTEEGDAGIVEL
jgi:hypothetical protein